MLACAGALCCTTAFSRDARDTRATRHARAASAPVTAAALGPLPAPGLYGSPPPTDGAVYRCGNSYAARPCDDAPPLDVNDGRTASQRLQAEDVAARDKRLASWLEAQRHEREAAASAPRKSPAAAAKPCVPTRLVACPKPRKPSTASKARLKSGSSAIFLPGN